MEHLNIMDEIFWNFLTELSGKKNGKKESVAIFVTPLKPVKFFP